MKIKKVNNYPRFKIHEDLKWIGAEFKEKNYVDRLFAFPKTLDQFKNALTRAYFQGRKDADRDWKTHAEKVMQHWGL